MLMYYDVLTYHPTAEKLDFLKGEFTFVIFSPAFSIQN